MTPLQEHCSLAAYPFEDERYHAIWWRHLAPKFDITPQQGDWLIYHKPFLKGLAKLRELRIATWNNAWSQDLTAERVQQLPGIKGWDCFKMLWVESRRDRQCFDDLAGMGYEAVQLSAPPQYICDIGNGVEAYLKSLSHNSRKNFTKKNRKAQPLNPQVVPVSGDKGIEDFFREFFNLHIPYWNEKEGYSYFNDPHERNFVIAWAKAMDQSGQLVAQRLYLNDEVANLNLGIVYGDTLYWLLTINTGAYHEFGPGILALYQCLLDTERRGLRAFNMGCGDYFYKVQAANVIEPSYTMVVTNPRSLKGKAYKAWLSRRQSQVQPKEFDIQPM